MDRRWMILLLALSLVTLFPGAGLAGGTKPGTPAASGIEIGDQAPDFTLEDVNGQRHSLSELRGKVVLVNFWATWCPPCRAEMPSMEKLNAMLDGEEFVLLAVNAEEDARDRVREFLQENPHSFPVLLDDQGEVVAKYGVFRFPETFIIRRDGVIAEHVVGAIDWTDPKIVNLLQFLIRG